MIDHTNIQDFLKSKIFVLTSHAWVGAVLTKFLAHGFGISKLSVMFLKPFTLVRVSIPRD